MIIPDEQGNTTVDLVRESGLRWACELGKLAGGHGPEVIWLECKRSEPSTLQEFKRAKILEVWRNLDGNIKETARALKVSRTTVYAAISRAK